MHRCGEAIFPWHVFHEGHGDFWNILGTTIRPFGLTANDRGLHVRIAEIETDQRKKSLLFLTCEPDDVLSFLGLDVAAYRQGWESVDEMFRFLAGGRLMRREAFVQRDLKANDRKRMVVRDCYRRFVEWALGSGLGEEQSEREQGKGETREQVLEEALEVFGKRAEYEERLAVWRDQQEKVAIRVEGREERKARALAQTEYADAWIRFQKQSLYKSGAG